MTEFQKNVYAVVAAIPSGETRSYKEIATAVGQPNTARAVGNVLNKNTNPSIPCHRVIKSNGKPGGYISGRNCK